MIVKHETFIIHLVQLVVLIPGKIRMYSSLNSWKKKKIL